ncbi:hypothetical protein Tco_0192943, partial [Tanacetum coccineum]
KASGVQFASGKASVAETVFQYGDASQASKKKSSLSTKASGVQLTASQSTSDAASQAGKSGGASLSSKDDSDIEPNVCLRLVKALATLCKKFGF